VPPWRLSWEWPFVLQSPINNDAIVPMNIFVFLFQLWQLWPWPYLLRPEFCALHSTNGEHLYQVNLKSRYAIRNYAADRSYSMTSLFDLDLWPIFLVHEHVIASYRNEHLYDVSLQSLQTWRRYALDKIWIFHYLQWPWPCKYWYNLQVSHMLSW
jgi:hypothetical protein